MSLLALKLGARDFATWGPTLLDFLSVAHGFDGTIVLIAPNGSRWQLTVDNNGALVTTAL